MSAAGRLIDRLEGVKPMGTGRWIAKCPAHPDRSPSLSIRELDDGRVLLHDFGGCDVADVLGALGLGMHDLFERPFSNHLERIHSKIPAGDALQALDHEITVAVLILDEITKARKTNSSQVSRLTKAAARIGAARDMVSPARVTINA
jgi:hypothetical protein